MLLPKKQKNEEKKIKKSVLPIGMAGTKKNYKKNVTSYQPVTD